LRLKSIWESALSLIAQQNRYAAFVAEMDKLKVSHHTHLAKLDALFASLQHRAFRGELDTTIDRLS
jgi:hypothetical protein